MHMMPESAPSSSQLSVQGSPLLFPLSVPRTLTCCTHQPAAGIDYGLSEGMAHGETTHPRCWQALAPHGCSPPSPAHPLLWPAPPLQGASPKTALPRHCLSLRGQVCAEQALGSCLAAGQPCPYVQQLCQQLTWCLLVFTWSSSSVLWVLQMSGTCRKMGDSLCVLKQHQCFSLGRRDHELVMKMSVLTTFPTSTDQDLEDLAHFHFQEITTQPLLVTWNVFCRSAQKRGCMETRSPLLPSSTTTMMNVISRGEPTG